MAQPNIKKPVNVNKRNMQPVESPNKDLLEPHFQDMPRSKISMD